MRGLVHPFLPEETARRAGVPISFATSTLRTSEDVEYRAYPLDEEGGSAGSAEFYRHGNAASTWNGGAAVLLSPMYRPCIEVPSFPDPLYLYLPSWLSISAEEQKAGATYLELPASLCNIGLQGLALEWCDSLLSHPYVIPSDPSGPPGRSLSTREFVDVLSVAGISRPLVQDNAAPMPDSFAQHYETHLGWVAQAQQTVNDIAQELR